MDRGSAKEHKGNEEVLSEEDKVQILQSDVDGVTKIMSQNMERILARGERLDILQNKAEDLERNASDFKKNTQKISRKYRWKNVKVAVAITVVVLILILIILFATGVIPVNK